VVNYIEACGAFHRACAELTAGGVSTLSIVELWSEGEAAKRNKKSTRRPTTLAPLAPSMHGQSRTRGLFAAIRRADGGRRGRGWRMTETHGIDEDAAGSLPAASVDPHRSLLRQPEAGALLFKVVKVRYLIDMLRKNYLHFQRVDAYTDDTADGEQLPLDRAVSASISFKKAPSYNLEKYYDTARARTYACCFSLEHSAHLWESYAHDGDAVCLAFDFDKLRERLNATLQASLDNHGLLMHGENRFRQIFSINYGIVEYVDREKHALHPVKIANPIQYTFLKDKGRFEGEKELRVALSALGIGQFVLTNGARTDFPPRLQMHFDYREAFSGGVITEILCPSNFVGPPHVETLRSEMAKLRMMATGNGSTAAKE
jgi:hypothetical protein